MCSAGVLPKDKLIKGFVKSAFPCRSSQRYECKDFTVRRLHGDNTYQKDQICQLVSDQCISM